MWDTITVDTTLDSDLISCPGDGVVIGTDGVTLDLNGHTIDGSDSTVSDAIDNRGGYDDVTIKNGHIRGVFYSGVFLENAARNMVRDLDVEGPSRGIALLGASDNVIASNTINDSTQAIALWGASNRNRVERNSATRTASGTGSTTGVTLSEDFLRTSRPSDNVLEQNQFVGFAFAVFGIKAGPTQVLGNSASDSGTYAIYFLSSGQATIEDNLVSDTDNYGIWVGDGIASIKRNTIQQSREWGILITLKGTAVIEDNVVLYNNAGLLTKDESNTTVINNQFIENTFYGINVDTTAQVTLLDGNAANHNHIGIKVKRAGSIVRMNTANYNNVLGIDAVPGVIDAGGNRARGNGDPRQCVNVVCM